MSLSFLRYPFSFGFDRGLVGVEISPSSSFVALRLEKRLLVFVSGWRPGGIRSRLLSGGRWLLPDSFLFSHLRETCAVV